MAYSDHKHHAYPDLLRHIKSKYNRHGESGSRYHSYPHYNESFGPSYPGYNDRPAKINRYNMTLPNDYDKINYEQHRTSSGYPFGRTRQPVISHGMSLPRRNGYGPKSPSTDRRDYIVSSPPLNNNIGQHKEAREPLEDVITTQPLPQYKHKAVKHGERAWDSSLFDCFDDVKTCLCVCCCTPFYECYVLETEFDEHCCNGWPCCCGPMATFLALRYQMRAEENIEGNLLEDVLTTTYCFPCMVCQLLREKRNMNTAGFKKENNAEAVMKKRAEEAYNEMQRF